MRVLVVDEDPAVLNSCCGWLIGAGCDVSTQRSAGRLLICVQRMQAELVLIEPLMNGLSSDELTLLLTSCREEGAPAVILHSRLRPQLLRVVANPREARGVLRKTDNAVEFLKDFRSLVAKLWGRTSISPRLSPAVSGTHRIHAESEAERTEVIELPRNAFDRRGG